MNQRPHAGYFGLVRESLRHLCKQFLQLLLAERQRLQASYVCLRELDGLQYAEKYCEIVRTAQPEKPSEVLLRLLTGHA
jgi:hypothetical protein